MFGVTFKDVFYISIILTNRQKKKKKKKKQREVETERQTYRESQGRKMGKLIEN